MTKSSKQIEDCSGNVINVNEACRLCLGNRLLVPLFGPDGLKQELVLKIQKHLKICVLKADKMPQNICYHCACTLIDWHNLMETAMLTHSKLKSNILRMNVNRGDNATDGIVSPCIGDKLELPVSIQQNKISKVYLKKKTKKPSKACIDENIYPDTKQQLQVNTAICIEDTVDPQFNICKIISNGNKPVVDSLLSVKNEPALEELPAENLSEMNKIIPTKEHCSANLLPGIYVLNQGSNVTQSAKLEETVLSEVNTLQRGVPTDPSSENLELPANSDLPSDMVVIYYNNSLLEENIEYFPLSLDHNVYQLGDTENHEYDNLTEEQEVVTDPLNNGGDSTEFFQVVLDNPKHEQECISDNSSPDIYHEEMLDNEESHGDVVIEYLTQDNLDLTYEEVEVEDDSKTDLKYYQCSKCRKIFQSQDECLMHEQSVHALQKDVGGLFEDVTSPIMAEGGKQKCTCVSCGCKFESFRSLRTHMKTNHAPKENICEFCGAYFRLKGYLDVHRRKHTGEKPIVCRICGKRFGFKNELLLHRKMHAVGRRSLLSCSICGKTFLKRSLVTAHERTHRDRHILCSLCGKVLKNKNSLAQHLSTHSTVRPFKCETCGKDFKRKIQLRLHSVVHSQECNFTCEVCASQFRSGPLLRQHQLSHSGARPFKCDMCGAAFNRSGNLSTHKKRHLPGFQEHKKRREKDIANKTLVQCPMCNKSFHSILTLKYHVGRHTGDKYPFDCDFCDKRFMSQVAYRTHTRTHTGERPFACSDCEKTFRSAASLKQHATSIHSNEYPHECTSCDRKFKRLQSLIVHRHTHTGEKNHKCPDCGRGFAEKGDMKKHLRTHDTTRAVRLKPKLSL